MAIRAVLFDLDDTLWRAVAPPDWDEITRLQSAELAPEFARMRIVDIECADFVRRFWAAFDAAYPVPNHAPEEPRWLGGPAVIRRALATRGVVCGPDDSQRLWEALHTVPLRHFNIRPFSDAVAVVEQLRAAGYRLAIVTGRPLSAEIVRRELRDQGLPDVFDAVVTSGEVGYRKAHTIVFESVLRRLGVSAAEAVMVGDSYEEDIVPAVQVGMAAVLKLNGRRRDAGWVLARDQIPSLAALLHSEVLCLETAGS